MALCVSILFLLAPQIHSKTLQNPPENAPKSSPKRSKIEVWRGLRFGSLLGALFSHVFGCLRASWECLGRVLGALGRLGSVLARLEGGLGASWGRLGASWRVLGASLVVFGRSWRRLGSDPKKNQEKSMVLASKIKPQNLKNQAPAAARARFLIFWLTPIFNEKSFKNQPKFNQKSTKNRSYGRLGRS